MGLSLRQLARTSGLSSSFISLVERGETSLSLTSLFTIAAALKTDPTDLIGQSHHEVNDEQPTYGIWRGRLLSSEPSVSLGERDYFQFSSNPPGAHLEPLLVNIQPSTQPKQPSTHDGEEVVHVLFGELQVTLGDQIVTLDAGDGIHFMSTTPHSVQNRTLYTTQAFWVTLRASSHQSLEQQP